MKTLKITYHELVILMNSLDYKVKFATARIRNRFYALLMPSAKDYEKSLEEITSSKKPSGKELQKLLDEEIILDLSTQVVEDMPIIVSMVENTQYEMTDNEFKKLEDLIVRLTNVTAEKPTKKKK